MRFSARDFAVKLLRKATERDRQVRVGASNLSNPCTRCLTRDLSGDRTGSTTRAWLGAVIGTAIHALLESRIAELVEEGFLTASAVLVEKKIEIGYLPGYGKVKSRPDCVMVDEKTLVDWKTSLRKKSKAMQVFLNMPVSQAPVAPAVLKQGEMKVRAYIAQLHLYAKGLVDAGIEIDTLQCCVVNRDATGWYDDPDEEDYDNENKQRDIWMFEVPYNPVYADSLWTRTETLWGEIQRGAKPMDFPRQESCHRCDAVEAIEVVDKAREVGVS